MPALESPQHDQQHAPAHPASGRTNVSGGTPTNAPGGSSRGSLARKVGLLLILVAAGGFTYWKIKGNKQEIDATANRTAAAANRAIPVTATAVVAKTMPIYLRALGTVTAYNTVTIKSRVDGQLMSVPVREGQQVRQGQVLATIDSRPYEATVAQAEGQLAKDQAAADYAKAEAGRYQSLFEAGVVSKDSNQVQASSAGQSAGVLEADRAAIRAAKVNVTYTRITSPINGVVGLRQVDAGNIVHASDANGLLVVTQLQPIAVVFTLPEDQLPTVMQTMRGGKKLVVEAYDRSETSRLATGSLLTLDNQIDTTTGTVKAKAVFDNRDGALFPNQFVNVRLILENRANSLVMPATALQTGSSGAFVFLLKPGNPPRQPGDDAAAPGGGGRGAGRGANGGSRAGNRPPAAAGEPGAGGEAPAGPPRDPYYVVVQNVVVDVSEGTQVILKSGLKAGDQVIVDGQEKLKPFSKVDPKDVASTGRGGRGGRGAAASDSGAGGAASSGSVETTETPGRRVGRPGGNAANAAVVSADEASGQGGSARGSQGGGQAGTDSGQGRDAGQGRGDRQAGDRQPGGRRKPGSPQ